MRIECKGHWQDPLAYFERPDTRALMGTLGLFVQQLDTANHDVVLGFASDADRSRILSDMLAMSTQ